MPLVARNLRAVSGSRIGLREAMHVHPIENADH
jgi:hypothetical protein